MRQDPESWKSGYQDGLEGIKRRPMTVPDQLAYLSGYIEGKAERVSEAGVDDRANEPSVKELIFADEVLSENDIYPLISRDGQRDLDDSPERRWMMGGLLFKRAGQTIAFLCQPYTLVTEDLRGILQFCDQYELDVDLSMRWQEPGHSILDRRIQPVHASSSQSDCRQGDVKPKKTA